MAQRFGFASLTFVRNSMVAILHDRHELGVIEFRATNYPEAEKHFLEALNLCRPTTGSQQVTGTTWEPTLSNLALTCHKQGRYQEAIQYYQEALAISPRSAPTYAGLAYTYHCMALLHGSSYATAIEWYHKALGMNPSDTFSSQMLQRALTEEVAAGPIE
jgi:anaphase-promoting complex subunit 6